MEKVSAIIYQPAKNAMQSGKGKTKCWFLEFDSDGDARSIDAIMGWTSSTDMRQELRMMFDTQEQAVAFAERHGIVYKVVIPKQPKRILKSYAENFTKPVL